MSIGAVITAQLMATSGVTGSIGTRLYPEYDREADHTYPLAVYKQENVTTTQANDGPIGLESADYVIAAMGQTYAQADGAAQAIKTALDGKNGTWSSVVVQGVFLKDDGIADDYETEPSSEEITVYIKTLTFTVWYES